MPDSSPVTDIIERPCPFITFYSFKGGVGRSMAVINVAGIMASRGFRVLVIDMDLEAPGLSFLANPAPTEEDRPRPSQPGFVDFMLDAVERGSDGDLFQLSAADAVRRYSAPYELPAEFRRSPEGSLHIMPTGRIDDDYARRLTRLDLPSLYQEGLGLALINAFKQVVQESKLYDYVFVDSRTGFSDESGICTRDLADCLMVVSGLNKQNVEGTTHFLSALQRATDERKPLEVILSPIPNGEDALVDEREKKAQAAFATGWGAPVRTELHLPYHPQLALTEEPHIFRRRRGHLFDAYNNIEQRVLTLLGETKHEFLHAARGALRDKDYIRAEACLRRVSKLSDSQDWIDLAAAGLDRAWLADVDAAAVFDVIMQGVSSTARTMLGEQMGHEALHLQRKKPKDAQTLYERSLLAYPQNVDALTTYADFLWKQQKDPDTAEELYKRAIDASAGDANSLGNYGRFCLSTGRVADGMELIERALASRANIHAPDSIDAKLWMYVFCCGEPERRGGALEQLRTFVETHDGTTGDWDFADVIQQARAMAHPAEEWLSTLADVLCDDLPSDVLDGWPAWRTSAGV